MDKQRRKELQMQARQVEVMMGVVKITNTQNGKIYIVGYPDLRNQWQTIQQHLDAGLFSSGALVRDWKALGAEAFSYEVLEEEPQGDETPEQRRHLLRQMERRWMDKLEPYDEKGYNRRPL